jgi:hypothetical protein
MTHLFLIESKLYNNNKEIINNSIVTIDNNNNIFMPTLNNIVLPSIGIELNFIIGTIIGDGSFYISFLANKKYKFGLSITTDIKDVLTLLKIKYRLNCGNLYLKSNT